MTDLAERLDETVTKRRDFLASLRDEPSTKPELVDRLDASRSTVDRAISDLQDHELVSRSGSEYQLTIVGKQAIQQYEQYLDGLGDLHDASEVIADIPADAQFHESLLEDAEVTTADLHDPNVPLDRTREIMETASEVRKVTPAVFPVCVELVFNRSGDGLSLELLVPGDVVETLRERYDFGTDGDTEEIDLFRMAETPPYGLWIADTPDGEYCGLMAHSETGVRGLIVTQSPEACEWADEQITSYRSEAERVEFY